MNDLSIAVFSLTSRGSVGTTLSVPRSCTVSETSHVIVSYNIQSEVFVLFTVAEGCSNPWF